MLLEELGKWDQAMVVAAQTHNEIAWLRASYHVVNGGEDAAYEPFTFEDPVARRERKRLEAEDAAAAATAQERFEAEIGFS